MKYEKYKMLTAEQKEEYKFRFANISYPRVNFIWFVVFISIFISVMSLYVAIDGQYHLLATQLRDPYVYFFKITSIYLYVFLFDYIAEFGVYFYKTIKRNRWVKKCLK